MGELIAERLEVKHIIHSLYEEFDGIDNQIMNFLDFKHRRRELAGITEKSLNYLFRNFKTVNEGENYYLKATCSNVVEDIENDFINSLKSQDINIGCITRLEKSYVPEMADEIIIFANKNKGKRVQLIIFGDSERKELKEELYRRAKGVGNLNLVITGFLFPIPRKIFSLVDVFIGVAGSARVSAQEMVQTITLDVIDGKPIGVLGYNTDSRFYRNDKVFCSLSQLFGDVLTNKNLYLKKQIQKVSGGLIL